MEWVALAVLISLDNVCASMMLGSLNIDKKRLFSVLALFALAEGLAPLFGQVVVGAEISEFYEWASVLFVVALCLLVALGGLLGSHLLKRLGQSPLIYLLPLLLAIDNFLAGAVSVTLSQTSFGNLMTLGIISASLCIVGAVLGVMISQKLLPFALSCFSAKNETIKAARFGFFCTATALFVAQAFIAEPSNLGM